MIAKQWTLNDPAAIVFMGKYPFDHGHYTMVIHLGAPDLPERGVAIAKSCASF
jgi:hypothetical protein